jgi:hypothetical protein
MTFIGGGWEFLWAPIGDYTLSRKTWYLMAIAAVAGGRLADRVPKPKAYAISCGLGLVACVVMAASSRSSSLRSWPGAFRAVRLDSASENLPPTTWCSAGRCTPGAALRVDTRPPVPETDATAWESIPPHVLEHVS